MRWAVPKTRLRFHSIGGTDVSAIICGCRCQTTTVLRQSSGGGGGCAAVATGDTF